MLDSPPEERPMRVGLVQCNTVVGDLGGNRDRILAAYRRAAAEGADLVVFPELALTGYPPRDLLELPDFLEALRVATAEVVAATGEAGLLFGVPLPNGHARGKPLLNGAILAANGREVARTGKKLLPTYDVFDETRQFAYPSVSTSARTPGTRRGSGRAVSMTATPSRSWWRQERRSW